jgi:hypothetical protein
MDLPHLSIRQGQLNTSLPHAKDDPQFIDINEHRLAMPNLSLLFFCFDATKATVRICSFVFLR